MYLRNTPSPESYPSLLISQKYFRLQGISVLALPRRLTMLRNLRQSHNRHQFKFFFIFSPGFKRVRTKTFSSRDGVSSQYVVFSLKCLLLYLIPKWQGAFYHPWFYCQREREAREQVRLASSPSRERSAFEKYYIKYSISYRGSIS